MNYRFLWILLLGVTATTTLTAQQSAVSFCLADSSRFIFEFDGRSYDQPGNVAVLHRLQPGEHELKVKQIMQLGNSQVLKPRFEGRIQLDPQTETHAVIDQNNQFRISGTEALEADQNRMPHRSDAAASTTAMAMSAGAYRGLCDNLLQITNERDRFASAKSLIATSTLNAEQIAGILLYFDAESHRIDLAEMAYATVTDPQHYDAVYRAFRYPSSVYRLNRRLRR